MTDSMKFGPEWLRNMNSEGPSAGVVSGGGGGNSLSSAAAMINDAAPIIMAQFRYGREEMLLLFTRCNLPPDPLKSMQGLYVEKQQMPINLITMTEEETRMWNKGINSDTLLRSKPGSGPGAGMPGTRGALGGRGGSMDRGRGRARGSYHYSRGLSYEETDTSNGFSSQRSIRSFDRTQSQGNWNERNGGDSVEYTALSPRKEFGARSQSDTNWRRHRGGGEEDDTWRGGRSDKWGRGSSNSWRESDSNWDRSNNNNNHLPAKKPWETEEHNLPEWATENPSESGGSFDASGAFHGTSAYSDDDDVERHHRSEQAKNNTSSTSQPRPTPHSKKEPPNIPNGNTSDTSNSTSTSTIKQSQSATSLSTENRPTNHPITTSASFSGVDMHASQLHRGSKPPTRREDTQNKQSSAPSHPHQQPSLTKHPAEAPPPTPVSPVVESRAVTKTSQEDEIEQRILNEAAQLMDEEEKDPLVSSTTGTPPLAHAQALPHSRTNSSWFYKDPQGNAQGPFQSPEMLEWYNTGYFKDYLLVRRQCDERYCPLSELKKLWDGVPFMLDYFKVPPIKKNDPVMNDEALLLQVHIQQQQHQLLMQRNQVLAKLRQQDNFNSLTLEQQQLLAHQAQVDLSLLNAHNHTLNQPPQPQPHTNPNVLAMMHQLAQYQQLPQVRAAPPVGLPVPTPAEPLPDTVQQLMQQMGLQNPVPRPTPLHPESDQRSNIIVQFMDSYRQRQANPHTMESVWGGTNAAPNFPAWSGTPGHPTNMPQSLWVDSTTKGIKTEQEVLEEQLRAEEKKMEELRKKEELQRLKEEEERQRRLKEEEELERKRKEEEEKERERERKRIQEEEERKKKEAAAAKKAELDRLRKEEEKKRKEEEKRRKEEERKRQEEEKKRAEDERKRLEEERKLKEEMTKRQNEALKRLQEQQQARVVKPTPAPWTTPETAGPSLADIQKTERKQQQLLREQQEMLKAYQEKHQQEQQLKFSKSSMSFKWAEPLVKNQPNIAKSLDEIQAEEHERMAKQAEKEKAERMAAAKDVPTPTPGSIWTSAPQSLSWNTASGGVWGTAPTVNSGSGGPRFWDEVSTKAAKPQQAPPAKSQAKTKAKKEEASVMKLFEKQMPKTLKSEEFNKWCSKSLAACSSDIDIPTFVEFLLSIESKDIIEYVHIYLGNTQEANKFASEFIERQSRLFSSDQPLVRPEPPASTQSNHFQEVKGKNKKIKKGKMTKVDSRILGFNVTAATDRINVGDRDYGEGL